MERWTLFSLLCQEYEVERNHNSEVDCIADNNYEEEQSCVGLGENQWPLSSLICLERDKEIKENSKIDETLM